jgi:predicted PurR-regulated permease PerM
MPSRRPRSSAALLALMWLGAIYALSWAQQLIIPVAFAILLALLLRPAMRKLRRWKVPEVIASFLSVAAVAALFILGMAILAGQGQTWLGQAPHMIERIEGMLPQGPGPLGNLAKISQAFRGLTQLEGPTTSDAEPVPVVIQSAEPAFALVGASSHFVASAVIVFILAFFLLAFSDTLLRQTVAAFPSFAEKRNVVELLHNVEAGISRYLGTITLINIGLGVATTILMLILRIPNPILWGVLVTTANFVPHVGAFICMGVLFVVGAVAHESLWYGAVVVGAFALLTTAESYFITPLTLSKSLQLSPLAVILFVLFWAWLWGIAGGLMAAPLLAILKIVCDQFVSLRAYAAILGGEVLSNGEADRAAARAYSEPPVPETRPVAPHFLSPGDSASRAK